MIITLPLGLLWSVFNILTSMLIGRLLIKVVSSVLSKALAGLKDHSLIAPPDSLFFSSMTYIFISFFLLFAYANKQIYVFKRQFVYI